MQFQDGPPQLLQLIDMNKIIQNKIRKFYSTFISLKGDPHKIAMGMAIGVFIGITPTIPLHTALVMIIVLISRQNLTAALLGTWINNPLTIPFFYWIEYKIGQFILGTHHQAIMPQNFCFPDLLQAGWKICLPLQIGGLLLAPLFAIPAYLITRKAIQAVRRKKENGYHEQSAQEV